MSGSNHKIETIDQYITTFPQSTRIILEKVKKAIKEVAPEAEEAIGYGIPTFKLNGNLVHFGGYKDHVGFYPGPGAKEAFSEKLIGYEGGRGTIKFDLNKPIPYTLIKEIVKFRVEQNIRKKR